jgi:hypothetical protein
LRTLALEANRDELAIETGNAGLDISHSQHRQPQRNLLIELGEKTR